MVYRLKFFGGEHDGESHVVHKNQGAIMGRSPTSSVYVRDKNVSRVHCQITVTDTGTGELHAGRDQRDVPFGFRDCLVARNGNRDSLGQPECPGKDEAEDRSRG
jgi:hypothetical protein